MSERTRCKFHCHSTEAQSGGTHCATMGPVYGAAGADDPENENHKFWEATPAGSLMLQGLKFQPFVPGKEYYLDITEAPS